MKFSKVVRSRFPPQAASFVNGREWSVNPAFKLEITMSRLPIHHALLPRRSHQKGRRALYSGDPRAGFNAHSSSRSARTRIDTLDTLD